MPEHFAFTKLVVADLEAAAAFYTAVFGMVEQGRVTATIADRVINEIMYEPTAPGAASFVLLQFEDRSAPATEELIVGFVTGDLDALVARAVANGGTVVDPIRAMPEHGIKVAFVADHEGHLIEVVELTT
jgi:predicted enzyme related to lactoylglutathione lyase